VTAPVLAAAAPRGVAPVTLDPLVDPRWTALLDAAPQAVVFHHPAWLRLLQDAYRHPISALGLVGPDGALVAGLPYARVSSRLTGRRLVALPFSDLCPPVLHGAAPPGVGRALAEELDALRRGLGVGLEVRARTAAWAPGLPGTRFHHHLLPLEGGVDAVQGRFRKPQVLRGVRRALREGLRVERRTDRAALEAFYRLHLRTRRRQGLPTQPRRFVLGLEGLFAARLGFVLVVHREGRPLAAAVFLAFHDVLTYKYGASDPRCLGARPNNLLFMEAIRLGCETGMHALDFGRTDWGHESLRAFKLAWGAEERVLRYSHLADVVPRGDRGRADEVLAAVLRRSPPLASRLVGEALYRHVG
jgi:CelD/BcsL family acetyltransferase involved in cellulose biosynthesis